MNSYCVLKPNRSRSALRWRLAAAYIFQDWHNEILINTNDRDAREIASSSTEGGSSQSGRTERRKGWTDPISPSPDEICNGVRWWRFRRRDALHYSLLCRGNTRPPLTGLSLSSLFETPTAFRLIPIKALASTPRNHLRHSGLASSISSCIMQSIPSNWR